jgi:hypothetical protein
MDATGTSSTAGSAPVIIRPASLTGSGVFSHGFFRRDRVDVVLVTEPSLSSLETFTVWLILAGFVGMGFVAMGFAVSLRGAAFVTRVAVATVADVILVLFGRGIVAISLHGSKRFLSRRAQYASVVVRDGRGRGGFEDDGDAPGCCQCAIGDRTTRN